MLDKCFDPKKIEQYWYQIWENSGFFRPSNHGAPYCIVMPPPNVTGSLHMGHGFQMSIMDALIRYKRMCGFNTLWQIGTDHAGIATQMIVENIFVSEGKDRTSIDRESFIKRIWEWKNISKNTITKQEKRLGISGDWNRERFTLDPDLVSAVQHVFIELYKEGLIYKGKKLVNWDPSLHTAISDLEVINDTVNGSLWYIKYPIVNSMDNIIIATTRPETILADIAVAVHPDDQRYKNIIGKKIILPLTNRVIPIIADETIDPHFGSGCVKITPAHDFNDYKIGQRHNLPIINILTPDAKLNNNVPEEYRGLDRFDARAKILHDLQSQGLLLKSEQHILSIPKGDRSNIIIEPYLTDQWFVKTKELAIPAIQAVTDGKIKFTPFHWNKIYIQWLENIDDWCISRQLLWGPRIPVWYDEDNNIYVGTSENEIRKKFNLEKQRYLSQDQDVLDTWFSSALWPFSSLGWSCQSADFNTFYPTSVLVTGYDIIFFWVARMVMFGIKFTQKVPFKNVYVTGTIRDSHGHKMSKSKGNVLDPIDLADGISLEKLVEKRTSHLMQEHMMQSIAKRTKMDFPNGITGYGMDALRFTFCSLSNFNLDINFDISKLDSNKKFCTKIWNAAHYVLLQNQQNINDYISHDHEFSTVDKWIQTELQKTLKLIARGFDNYRFDLITKAIYKFVWNEFCDWYVEIVKSILNSQSYSMAIKYGAKITLISIFENILRLIHPFMPFISEELWQEISKKMNIEQLSIMNQQYPVYDKTKIDKNASDEILWVKQIITTIRSIRNALNIPQSQSLLLLIDKGDNIDRLRIEKYKICLLHLANLTAVDWIENNKTTKFIASTVSINTLELNIAVNNHCFDINLEIKRLNKKINLLETEIDNINNRLNNKNYINNAPSIVIDKDKTNLVNKNYLLENIRQQLYMINK